MYNKLIVNVDIDLNDDLLQYILDCWCAFVCDDLGLSPEDMLMIAE